MHTFEYLTYKRNYPGIWNEMSQNQLLFVAQLFGSNMELEAFNTLVLQNFTDIKWEHFFNISSETIAEMAKTIEFLHNTKELTINLLPKLKVKHKKLEGPADAMINLTFEQFFGHTEPAFTAYAQNDDKEMLNHLVAVLYSFENGKFNADLIDENKELVKGLKKNYKTAVLLFYLGFRDLITAKFPKLFKSKKTTGKASDLHYFEMIENLNNENITNNEKIKQSNIYEAFIRLTAMIEKAENLKKQNK